MSSLSKEEKIDANNQTVPSLSELLVMVKKHNVSLIFDLKNEKNSTGFHNSDSYYTTETIKKSGISPEKVIICMCISIIFSETSKYAHFSLF